VKVGRPRVDTYDLCRELRCLELYYEILERHAEKISNQDAAKLLKALKAMKKNVGIASRSHRRTVELFLKVLGVREFVDFIFCHEGYDKGQEDYFEKLAEKLHPDECMVIDNDENMVEKAGKAGFKTMHVKERVKYDLLKYL